MKVLFLDFDGVLNGCAENMGSLDPRVAEPETELWCAEQIDHGHVERLNEIVDATGAVVVLSTSWRNVHPLNRLRGMLQLAGFRGFILGDTPRLHRTPDGEERHREHEIEMWLEAAGDAVESYVTLDDWNMGHLRHRLVQCTVQIGIQPEQVARAIELLEAV